MKIYTHNSATGERGHWTKAIWTPFARCQAKTLVEQVQAGATWLDLRIRKRGDKWVFAHGLWESRDGAIILLEELNAELSKMCVMVYANVIYEGAICDDEADEFVSMAETINTMSHICVTTVRDKKTWYLFETINREPEYEAKFHILNRHHGWRFLLPIPILWWWLRTKKMREMPDDDSTFAQVDFL